MRRTTSALTTTILGAVLAAPAVSAQQSPPARGETAASVESDAGFGMAAARGARSLLRNGLDYIEYQEYDRALRYLREAEKRQAELNEPEKTKLKQAIERAMRGTREAIGSERPYARSERSLRSGGFAPAAAEAAVEPAVASKSNQGRPAVTREGDDTAEPIRLAGAEAPAPPSGRRPPRVPSIPTSALDVPEPPEAAATKLASVAAPPLEPADETTTAPPVVPIGAVEPGPRPIPTAADLAPAADSRATAMAQSDLNSPFPSLEPTPDLDPAVARSSSPSTPAPAPTPAPDPAPTPAPAPALPSIRLDLPDEVTRTPAAEAPTPAPDPAPAPIQLELPDEMAQAPAGDAPPTPPAPHETATPASTSRPDPNPPLPSLDDPALDLPALPAELTDGPADAASDLPDLPATASPEPAGMPEPSAEVAPELAGMPEPPGEIAVEPAGMPEPADAPEPPAEAAPEPADPAAPPVVALRPEPEAAPEPAQEPVEEPAPADEDALPLPAPADVEEPAPADEDALPTPAPADVEEPAPAAEEIAPAPARSPAFATAPASGSGFIPTRGAPKSTLSPELERDVSKVVDAQERAFRERIARQTAAQPLGTDPGDTDLAAEARLQTQVDISRAPSPAEARPISAVPVPEDWVPLGGREWSPQRKYWAAAATAPLPLYFQDPMLERYGHSVENYLGPLGRFFAYPVDDYRQSTQRMQMLQPWASAGQFAFQIITLPYALVVDPPWESQYDLGYWRPGDKIPTDLYYLPTHGTGPPLHGNKY